MVRPICSGGEGEWKERELERHFCSGCVESYRDEESAIDIWYEAGKWIQTLFIVQLPIMGQDLLIVEASR